MLMKFWLRENGSPPFQGPFTLAEVAAGLKAGQFSDACELLVAEGQSYGALKRATGWRAWRSFNVPKVPDIRHRPLPVRAGTTSDGGSIGDSNGAFDIALSLTDIIKNVGDTSSSSAGNPK
jgi:hypothetical protein